MTPKAKRAESIENQITGWIHQNDRQLISAGAMRMIQREVSAALSAAERRAYRSLARWAVKRASQKQRTLTVARQAGRSLTAECRQSAGRVQAECRQSDVEALLGVADECRRRAKGKA